MTADDELREALEGRVRDALPGLAFTGAVLNTYGEDNYVLEIDRAWIVRIPRDEAGRSRFAAELNLLAALGPIAAVPVPRYGCIAADGSMGAYRRIDGAEMTPPVFALLDRAAQRDVLNELAHFLSTLHALPEATIRQPDGMTQRTWRGEQFAALYRGMRRAKIARVTPPGMLARFDAFHAAFETERPFVPRLAHGDLSDDHILLRPDGTLAGIIDFTDAAWGDPAIDFAWFWRLGEARLDFVLERYALAAEDTGLKTRSHWTFVRYLISQIAYGDKAKWNLPPEQALAELDGHLKRLGF
ncbi:MAG TPA: phosphotransferase [Rhizomicrobium sp.]|jgi:aminoglycoside 2''-phosphotransferase|nr:phosphotransferase [Rhizomicrobium sp.]